MNITDLQFDLPKAIYLVFLIPLIFLLAWNYRQYRNKVLKVFTTKEHFSSLIKEATAANYWIKIGCFGTIFLLLMLVIMQPKGNPHYPHSITGLSSDKQEQLAPHEIIIFVDVSASMAVEDGRLKATRLQNAKDIISQMMHELNGQTASLYAFTSDVTKVSPPSMDYLFMQMMLQNLYINDGDITGTDIKKVLEYLTKNYLESKPGLIKTVILLSDGEDNNLLPGSSVNKEQYTQEVTRLLNNAKEQKLHVYTVGLGTTAGGDVPNVEYQGSKVASTLHEDFLKSIATAGLGNYYAAKEFTSSQIADELIKSIKKEDLLTSQISLGQQQAKKNLMYDYLFQIPLFLALLLFIPWLFYPEIPKKLFLLIVLLLPVANGYTDTKENLLETGIRDYEAYVYDAAIENYGQLLKTSKSSELNQVVFYDLAIAKLKKNEESGQRILQALLLDSSLAPLIRQKALEALTEVHYNKASQLKKNNTIDSLYEAIYYYKQAIVNGQAAIAAECNYIQMMGKLNCDNHEKSILNIINESKENIALLTIRVRKDFLANVDLKQGLAWLITSQTLLIQDLEHLKGLSSLNNFISYQEQFQNNLTSWIPLWQSLLVKNEKMISAPYNQFLQSIEDIKDNQLDSSLKTLQEVKNSLKESLKEMFSGNNFDSFLEMLLSDFTLAKLQDPLDIHELVFLRESIQTINPKNGSDVLKNGLDAMKDNLEHSILNVQKKTDLAARLYFDEAYQQLKRILLSQTKDIEVNPEIILKAAIDEQRHALSQTRLMTEIRQNKDASLNSTALTFAKASQDYVLSLINYFYQATANYQKASFTTKDDKQGVCQYHPWKELVPLFEQGVDSANKSATAFKVNDQNTNKLLSFQEETINFWTKAISQWNEKSDQKGCLPPITNAIENISSFADRAHLIQLMNKEDNEQKQNNAPLKQGLRSW